MSHPFHPGPMLITLILHERRAHWARRLRPAAAGWGVRLVETRSATELADAAAPSACPVVLIDADGRPRFGVEGVDEARRAAPDALILALAEGRWAELATALHEAGATLTLPANGPPPAVIGTLRRWVDLARERVAAGGWADDRRPEPEPWESLLADSPAL